VIGDEILSGRTKDKNIGYIAEYLTALGIDLEEVRVVGDEEAPIVEALNALRQHYTNVLTTGGIGPTHDDITADCVAKAFGVPIDIDPRALAILKERVRDMGVEINEARLRMTRIPQGADLVQNKVSGAPGFWIGNVIVMAGADAPLPVRLRQGHVEAAMPFHPTRRRLLAASALGAAHLVLDDAFAQPLAPTPQCHDGGAPTIRETEGPYFKPSSPQRADLVEPEGKARLVELSGQVFTRSCRPV